jgi:hypothetical protein
MNYDQGLPPVFPKYRKRDPEPAIPTHNTRAFVLAFVNGELLSESEILQDNTAMVLSEQPDHAKETQEEGEHGGRFFLLAC